MHKLLLAATIIGTLAIPAVPHAQPSGSWYYCDPTHAYYPYVTTCPVPWRAVAPGQQQDNDAAAQARKAEAQRAAAQARADAEARTEAEAEARAAAAQTAAETSPDNVCRQPDTARRLIDEYNGIAAREGNRDSWPEVRPREVVDIEHLVTVKSDPDSSVLICHGVWVLTNGTHIEGTMAMRPNVAGDIVVSWEVGHWQPPASAWAAPQHATTPPPAPAPSNVSTAFQQGVADRTAWEDWFATTSGDYRNGALYWTGQRSLPHPGSCSTLGGDATAGCLAAQPRLVASDSRRKQEPDYRQGWNSYPAPKPGELQ